MKCRINVCHAKCCNSVPFANNELTKYADKIVNPVVDMMPLGHAILPFTVPVIDHQDLILNSMLNNKCPFLRKDYRCNIYENRPEVCRLFGEIPKMPCDLRKKIKIIWKNIFVLKIFCIFAIVIVH